jgi:hypothetical protein
MKLMPAVHEITTLDTVELIESVAGVPAGSRAGVLELRDDDVAMIEITSMPLEPILDRIVFVPLSKLRRVNA